MSRGFREYGCCCFSHIFFSFRLFIGEHRWNTRQVCSYSVFDILSICYVSVGNTTKCNTHSTCLVGTTYFVLVKLLTSWFWHSFAPKLLFRLLFSADMFVSFCSLKVDYFFIGFLFVFYFLFKSHAIWGESIFHMTAVIVLK